MTSKLKPASIVQGMKSLDKSQFRTVTKVLTVTLDNESDIPTMTKTLKPYFLKLQKFKPIVRVGESEAERTKIFIDPLLYSTRNRDSLVEVDELTTLVEDSKPSGQFCVSEEDITLEYDNFSHERIFDAILPPEFRVSSFTLIGHILHLNLKDELFPYKDIIGQVLLDKIEHCRTVVNKLDIIDNEFRYFDMEILAGDHDTVTMVKEHGCSYELDFTKVFWNSRLGTEHGRLVDQISSNDLFYDLFAGIGPFAIPAAKLKKCAVVASDLNPESYKWLCSNVKRNKVQQLVSCLNLDAKVYILEQMADDIKTRLKSTQIDKIHISMNLPVLAYTFVQHFVGAFSNAFMPDLTIILHCYCFAKADTSQERETTAIDLVCNSLASCFESMTSAEFFAKYGQNIHRVRNVAPNKDMFCVSTLLPNDCLTWNGLPSEPPLKKICTVSDDL